MGMRIVHPVHAYLAILLVALFISAPQMLQAELPPEQKSRVLILNSYHPYYLWSDNEINGIVETLKKSDAKTEPIVEYLDCKFFPRMDHFEYVRNLFAHKFKGIRIQVIIAADNPSLEFALKYRDEIFPGVPIIFCGINGFEPKMIAGINKISGVAELLDIRGTIEMMLRLHPHTKEIFLIHDYTTTGMATRRQAERDLKDLGASVSIRYMKDITTAEMLAQVRNLPPTSLVLALSYSRDSEGRVFDHTQIARLLGEASPVPVYAGHEERLGFGIVGGSLLGGRLHGAKAAELALAHLGGTPIESIPVYTDKTTRPMFDFKQLERFQIPLGKLPPDSIIINRQPSFYQQNTGLVWAACGTIISLSIIIALMAANISQKRKATLELAHKAQELEQANAELQEFTMLSYHDLQEPLRNISGFVQLLEKRYRGKLGKDANEYISITIQNVNHMKQLFSDLTSYMRLTPRELRRESLDGSQVLSAALSRMSEHIGRSRAQVNFDRLPPLYADREMLTLLFCNLISNAIKFSPAAPHIHIGAHLEPGRVVIFVKDNGIGIAAEYHERIFQIFKKLHTRNDYAGTGIGLAICKRIVELHNGRIWLESEPSQGSTFFFSIPVHAEDV